MIEIILFAATIFLAYSNGANDNFKGVATLFGSKTTNYKTALAWGTVTTLAGSCFSILIAHKLVIAFSGKGLVSTSVTQMPEYLLAVGLGAALTVFIATLLGFPISTTHALIGSLVGSGFMASGADLNFAALSKSFIAPLLISPIVALSAASLIYIIFRKARQVMGVTKEYCLCVGKTQEVVAVASSRESLALMQASHTITNDLTIDKESVCIEKYEGSFLGIKAEKILDVFHFLSAGVVSFARGLNDTPKIMGILIVVKTLDLQISMVTIAIAMAIGGLLSAKKVAHVMSNDITYLNHGQGFTANLVTGIIVLFASKFGMPGSTTHVSVSALFGIGMINKKANYRVIGKILLSWLITLPLGALLAGSAYYIIQQL